MSYSAGLPFSINMAKYAYYKIYFLLCLQCNSKHNAKLILTKVYENLHFRISFIKLCYRLCINDPP